jgi:hypothetical protein
MKRSDHYRAALRPLADWDAYLLAESGLPGPRANLELLQVVADEGTPAQFRRWAALGPEQAPGNAPEVFLTACGVVGLGRLLAEGKRAVLRELRRQASDPRWRVREAVAMALQRLGDRDVAALLDAVTSWARGSLLEQRAAAAGVCEPRLLRDPDQARRVLALLDTITAGLAALEPERRRDDDFRSLRQALGYCWSVAIIAAPEAGKAYLEKWAASPDRDLRWIVRENLKKDRLRRMDAGWVAKVAKQLS